MDHNSVMGSLYSGKYNLMLKCLLLEMIVSVVSEDKMRFHFCNQKKEIVNLKNE